MPARALFERLSSLRHVTQEGGDRWQILKDLSVAWRQFPVVGTGLGTHRFIFPIFDRSTIFAIANYAENDYAQLMEETGGIGLLLCLLFIAQIMRQYIKCVRQHHRAINLATFGLGYGLLAILIHSFTDFGEHLPAIACLTAAFAGLLVSIGPFEKDEIRVLSHVSHWLRRLLGAAVPVALAAAIIIWCVPGADTARRSENALSHQATRLADVMRRQPWSLASDAQYIDLLKAASTAAQIAPDDVTLRFWLNTYRWLSISRPAGSGIEHIAMDETTRGFVRRIVQELNGCRLLCPTFAPPYSLAGQLEYFVLKMPEGAQHIRMAFDLDRCDPTNCVTAAFLDADEHRWDQAFNKAQRAIVLDSGRTDELIDLFVGHDKSQLAHDLIKSDRWRLLSLAKMLDAQRRDPQIVEECRREANGLLMHEAESANASAETLAEAAEVYAAEGNDPLAIALYRRALAPSYSQVDWHVRLAELLLRSGQPDQARHEVLHLSTPPPGDEAC